jgi:hypothetical protein
VNGLEPLEKVKIFAFFPGNNIFTNYRVNTTQLVKISPQSHFDIIPDYLKLNRGRAARTTAGLHLDVL